MNRRPIPAAALALGAALASAPALARDLSWSLTIGSGGALGVHVGVPGVAVVAPAPVIVAAPPPRPRPVVFAVPAYPPMPVVVAPPRYLITHGYPLHATPAVVARPLPVIYVPYAHGKHAHPGHRGKGRGHPHHR